MDCTRRDLLQNMARGAVAAMAAGTALPAVAEVALEEKREAPATAIAMLYDATRCIGCQACVSACAQANNLSADKRLDPLHQSARDLNSTTKNVIKLYQPTDGSPYSFVKQQCMHCVDPACVASCMFRGLNKQAGTGIVTWNPSLCVGCRYCEIACPYHIPKFQWNGFNPKIVKCEFCKERVAAGLDPACTSVCPTQAVIYGKRTSLLQEAALRIKRNPGKYYQDRAFGEHEGGGTQVLYLAHAPFEKLGLPRLDNESIPGKYLKWQKRIYSYLMIPGFVYVTMVGLLRKNWKHHEAESREDEKSTGLRPQL